MSITRVLLADDQMVITRTQYLNSRECVDKRELRSASFSSSRNSLAKFSAWGRACKLSLSNGGKKNRRQLFQRAVNMSWVVSGRKYSGWTKISGRCWHVRLLGPTGWEEIWHLVFYGLHLYEDRATCVCHSVCSVFLGGKTCAPCKENF